MWLDEDGVLIIFRSLVVFAADDCIFEPREPRFGAVDELLALDEGILLDCLAYAIGFMVPPVFGGPPWFELLVSVVDAELVNPGDLVDEI